MKTNNTLAEIAAGIRAAKKITIISHYNPDADALGSTLGLSRALRNAGKQVLCVNESNIPERYVFLPGSAEIKNDFKPADFDAICILDCGEAKRVGDRLLPHLSNFANTINIDHHITNNHFGMLNLVGLEACSTCEIVFDVLNELSYTIDADTANCLYAGICGDTGSFRYASTSARSFEIAKQLTLLGASPHMIADAIYGSKPIRQVRLEAMALNQLRLHEQGRVAEVLVTEEMYKLCAASADDTEFLVESARDIAGVQISILIRHDFELWKVSLRASGTKLNVASIASKFGGGGHRPAAAFRWKGELEELRRRLLQAVSEELAVLN